MENSKRRTIGTLVGFHIYDGSHPDPYASPVIRGMQSAARDKNVNIMVACGVGRGVGPSRHMPAWPELNEETDFVPIGPWNTDGLIFLVPLITKPRIEYAQRLADNGFPVIFVGSGVGHPAIIVDNEGGIRQVIEHLVQHHHRDIAFIAGDELDPGDSTARVNAFRRNVKEFGLSDDPRLLEYGMHWDVGGYRAMQRLLQSGVKFTAVMCSNDQSAFGAMKALREAGKRIPWDVAVTGFDDIQESQAHVPPLTSVHASLFETGYRALMLLLKRIEQGPAVLPEFTCVSTHLTPRQSCGCLPEMVALASVSTGSSVPNADGSPQHFKEELAHAMQNTLEAENSRIHDSELTLLCGRLADNFLLSLEGGDISHFQNTLIEILQHVEMTSDDSTYIWQSVVSVLRLGAYAFLKSNPNPLFAEHAENLLHLARVLISESAQGWYTRLQVNQTNRDEIMGLLTARLISNSEEGQVYTTLREDLPQLGVRTCNVAFFDPRGEDPAAMSLLHSTETDAPILRFETRRFPPPGLYPAEEPFNLALLPLFFQSEKLGYVAFDGGNLDPLATLVRQLSSSIKNARLHAEVLELSLTDGLTSVHNRRYFEIMLQKETERSNRYNRDLAVIMIDIDHFKQYNDTFGHPAGDEALRAVANCIIQGARRGLDMVTRYGGEEFTILLPETDVDGARIVAETIREGVQSDRNLLQPTTVSLGITAMCGKGVQPQALVDQADRALYQAKAQGRNRTIIFTDWMRESAHTNSPSG